MNTNPITGDTVTYCRSTWRVIATDGVTVTIEQFRVDLSGEGAFCVATVRPDELDGRG